MDSRVIEQLFQIKGDPYRFLAKVTTCCTPPRCQPRKTSFDPKTTDNHRQHGESAGASPVPPPRQ